MENKRFKLTADSVILGMASVMFVVSVSLLVANRVFRVGIESSSHPRVGVFSLKVNDVRRKLEGGLEWVPIKQTAAVFEGDSVFTDANSEATVDLDRGGQLVVKSRSLVVIRTLASKISVDLTYGSLHGKVDGDTTLIVNDGTEPRELHAENADFVLSKNEGSDEATVQVLSGKVEVKSEKGTEVATTPNLVRLKRGEAPQVKSVQINPTHPANGATIWTDANTPVKFEWTTQGDLKTDKFVVEMATDREFHRNVKKITATGSSALIESRDRPSGSLFWRVRSADDAYAVSQPQQLKINPDISPALLTPEDNQVLTYDVSIGEANKPVTLSWRDEADSAEFKVEVAKDRDFKDILHSKSTTASSETTPSLPAGSYYWRVTGLNRARTSQVPSAVGAFEVRAKNAVPETPQSEAQHLTYEIPKKVITRTPASTSAKPIYPEGMKPFSWHETPDAKEYEVELGTDEKFTSSKKASTGLATSYIPQEVQPGSYYLRVRTKSADGIWSEPSKVTSLDVDIPAPEINAPKTALDKFASDDEAKKAQHEFEFKWTPRPWAASYEFEFATKADFSDKQSFKTAKPSQSVKVANAAKYFYRVRALASNGKPISEFSAQNSVQYEKAIEAKKPEPEKMPETAQKPEPPKRRDIVIATPDSTDPQPDTEVFTMPGAPTYVPFKWKKIKDATGYTLQVSSQPSFEKVIIETYTRSNNYVLQEKLPAGKVYWRVRAEHRQPEKKGADRNTASTTEPSYSEWSKPSSLNLTYGRK